jgi:hypothetical protein
LGNAVLVQSNEPDASEPANGARRINSGFYYAIATRDTISAFQAIVDHAALTNFSEQISFNEVLCGVEGAFREGDDACQKPGGVRTLFLNRDMYPKGKHRDLWEAPEVVLNARALGVKVMHNNWVVGSAIKLRRQKTWWHYDEKLMMCTYNWSTGAAAK